MVVAPCPTGPSHRPEAVARGAGRERPEVRGGALEGGAVPVGGGFVAAVVGGRGCGAGVGGGARGGSAPSIVGRVVPGHLALRRKKGREHDIGGELDLRNEVVIIVNECMLNKYDVTKMHIFKK